jgi:DUF4097 and DUF4098 domain-containing protein YvlB
MLTPILLGLALAVAPQAVDTTFTVEPGGRLEVESGGGGVTVRAWDRNQVRVRSTARSRGDVSIRQTGRVVYVTRALPGAAGDVEITVPAGYAVSVRGHAQSADIEGIGGDVTFASALGSARIRRVGGAVRAESFGGGIDIEDVRGSVQARSANRDVSIVRAAGDVVAETVNGAITMRDVTGVRVSATTVNGNIRFAGSLAADGQYAFAAHNGDVALAIPERSSAGFHIATFNGRFDAGFPVQVQAGGDARRFSFVLGAGSARVEVETFNGNIRVVRP